MQIPSGSITPISPQRKVEEEFEFGVSLSPNGRQGVHVVWHDRELARVEVFALDGSTSPITLTSAIGRYSLPSFSSRGDSVVFNRGSADTLSGPLYNQGAGIYVVDLAVGESGLVTGVKEAPRLVTSGSRATFSQDGSSLLVQRGSRLVQVPLQGGEEKVLATGNYATMISPSPDLVWVAFVEFSEAYLAPLQLGPNGEAMQLSTKPGFTPKDLRRLSPNGGDLLSWPPQGDSKQVSFLLGATFYSLSPLDAFSCPADESNQYGVQCVASKAAAIDLSLEVETNIPQTSVVFDNAILVCCLNAHRLFSCLFWLKYPLHLGHHGRR